MPQFPMLNLKHPQLSKLFKTLLNGCFPPCVQ